MDFYPLLETHKIELQLIADFVALTVFCIVNVASCGTVEVRQRENEIKAGVQRGRRERKPHTHTHTHTHTQTI
jgi:hypothetical protein